MSLIETYNNADNAHRQEMFYEYLKKNWLERIYKQTVLNVSSF